MRSRATTPLKCKFNDSLKIRQSWSKYNLYNLSRLVNPSYRSKNFFQLKWHAKSLTRKYHGEQVREKQWVRMFDRRLKSVIPMDAEYLAMNDGSFESAGRGSGVEHEHQKSKPQHIPYMQMTYAPLERRLDTAIFRAMFASSARQARQFVVHGAVRVNGKQMRYPGYLLNPGDMFQVLPERVMFATGSPKVPTQAKESEEELDGEEDKEERSSEEASAEVNTVSGETEDVDIDRDPREILRDLQSQAKSILAAPKENIGAKRKQDLRAFSKAIKRLLSKSTSSTILTDSLEAQFAEIQQQLKIRRENKPADTTSSLPERAIGSTLEEATSAKSPAAAENPAAGNKKEAENKISDSEYNELFSALRSMRENPIDDSKPYATPWMPRDYMSAFAFIPRYLEVNHNICAAVYLRHPVSRPGLAEIPTPYNEGTTGTAFAWYLRRR